LQDDRGGDLRRDDIVCRRRLRLLLQQPVSRAGVQYFALDRHHPRTHRRGSRHIVGSSPWTLRGRNSRGGTAKSAGIVRHRRSRHQAGGVRRYPAARCCCHARRGLAMARAQARSDGAAEMTALLSVNGVTKQFRGLLAVDSVTFDVAGGEIFAVIGPNGAGKTTLFNMVAGMLAPTSGSITFAGERIEGLAPDKICRRGIGRTFQIVRPFPALTVEDDVIVGALLHRRDLDDARQHDSNVLRRLDLHVKRNQTASSLTLPDRKRLELARALATDPKLLLLDEVMAGLRPMEVDVVVATLRELNRETGLTILLIEHVMRAVMALAGRLPVLHRGAAIADGAPDAVVRNPAVIDSYLGAEAVG